MLVKTDEPKPVENSAVSILSLEHEQETTCLRAEWYNATKSKFIDRNPNVHRHYKMTKKSGAEHIEREAGDKA